jgi:hypothetical protein
MDNQEIIRPNQSNSCPVSKKINREDAKNAKIFKFFLGGLSVLAVQNWEITP